MTEPATYPQRPRFFAHRAVRVLFKMCVAQEIGQEAVVLLVAIAMQEDAKKYRAPVTFFNEQLAPICGFRNVKALMRAREKAVAAGWLAYLPGTKGKAARYWVTIPGRYEGLDDAPTDENPAEFSVENDTASGRNVGRNPGGIREECGSESGRNVSNIHTVPDPIPSPYLKTPPNPPPGFDRFWAAYPRKVAKAAAEKVFTKLKPDEALLELLLAALARQRDSPQWRRDGGQYIPHPATWLNGRRWEDQTTQPGERPHAGTRYRYDPERDAGKSPEPPEPG